MPAQPPRSEPRADADVPALVSLYCGAGGLDIGFSRAGFDHLVALDSSPAAVRSWNHNLGSEVGRTADLDVDADLEGIVALTRGRQVGILGGPPCQGFSRARSNGVADDPRLRAPVRFAEICTRVAQEADVAFVVLENVDALLADRHADVVEEVTGHLTGIGLSVGTLVLQALDHGVAQRRSRAFLVATPVTGAEPQRSGADTATVRDVIEALPCP
ncbi:MAG: DNA cytosine methyltransferase, partial [Actinomycetota bacterium]